MVQNDFLLSLLGYNGTENSNKVEETNTNISYKQLKTVVKEEMLCSISDMTTIHADSPEYATISNNVKTLSEILNNLEKSETEANKVELQLIESQNKRTDSHLQMITKISGIVAYAGLVAFWIGLERSSTVPQKLVNSMNQLVRPSV